VANIVFQAALGKIAYYASLPAANDELLVVLLSGTPEADSTLATYSNLAALLGSNTEQTTMGRKAMTTVTVTTGNPTVVTADNVTWTAATGAAVAALLVCYVPDTTSMSDSTIVPLAKYDFVVTPSGTDVTAVWASSGAGGVMSASN
jgi:hypothetical protein